MNPFSVRRSPAVAVQWQLRAIWSGKSIFRVKCCPIAFVTTSFVNMLYCFVVVFAVVALSDIGFNFYALLCLPFLMPVEYAISPGVALLTSAVAVSRRDEVCMFDVISICGRTTTQPFYRFLILDLLKAYTKVLYLDCDTIVRRDIADLYDIDLGQT